MKYWLPELVLGSEEPAQTALLPKIGGLPWGFPADRWPTCTECQQPLHHYAQLPHTAPMLDFVEPNTVLHIFLCDHDTICTDFSDEALARAVVVVPTSQIGRGSTPMPPVDAERKTLTELRITGWRADGDALTEDHAKQFYDHTTHDPLPEDIAYPKAFDAAFNTKAGGLPYWATASGAISLDYPNERVVMQFDSRLPLAREPKIPLLSSHESGLSDAPFEVGQTEDSQTTVQMANFYFDGIGFLVRSETSDGPVFTFTIRR